MPLRDGSWKESDDFFSLRFFFRGFLPSRCSEVAVKPHLAARADRSRRSRAVLDDGAISCRSHCLFTRSMKQSRNYFAEQVRFVRGALRDSPRRGFAPFRRLFRARARANRRENSAKESREKIRASLHSFSALRSGPVVPLLFDAEPEKRGHESWEGERE